VPWWSTICTCEEGGACGGERAGEGCANSSGLGARLSPLGTPSRSDWTLSFDLAQASKSSHAYLIGGPLIAPAPFYSGLLCLGRPTGFLGYLDLAYVGKTDASGSLAVPPSAAYLVSGGVVAGDTWGYQVLFRDAKDSCKKWNLSSGVAVTFTP